VVQAADKSARPWCWSRLIQAGMTRVATASS